MRVRTRLRKVDPLPITTELLLLLSPLTVTQRRTVFEKADVPYASLHQWANGYYHPGAQALDKLFRVLGRELVSRARVSEH